jgi:alpha-ketoglutarate-dependent taurine dioxygenase
VKGQVLTTSELLDVIFNFGRRSGGELIVEQVDLDFRLFISSIECSRYKLVPSRDGEISTIKQGAIVRDISQSSGNFDFHTDGLYLEHPPEFVMLYCVNPGRGLSRTAFVDGAEIVRSLRPDMLDTLSKLDLAYIARDESIHRRKLLQVHPRTGEDVLLFGSRTYVCQSDVGGKDAEVPTIRELTAALGELFREIDRNRICERAWNRGDVIVFDNYRYIHRRIGSGGDPDRELKRIWLTPNV